MKGFLIRMIIISFSLAIANYIVEGIEIASIITLIVASLVIGFLNSFIRPILLIMTLPFNILTFGLFTFVINAILLLLASQVVRGMEIEGFWAALAGTIIMSMLSFLLNLFVSDSGKVEVFIEK